MRLQRSLSEDDEEIKDLLGHHHRKSRSKESNNTMISMNLDHLVDASTKQKFTVVHVVTSSSSKPNTNHMKSSNHSTSSSGGSDGRYGRRRRRRFGRQMSCWEYHCTSYVSILCNYYPKFCGFCIFLGIAMVLIFLESFFIKDALHNIPHSDAIRSQYDTEIAKIDHWCLDGGNDQCQCEDPLTPLSRHKDPTWIRAFKANRRMVKKYKNNNKTVDNAKKNILDVVFLGDSIVEILDGRWMGRIGKSRGMQNLESIFQSNFQKSSGASVEGLALGIAGDTAPNILWRLLHGELPDWFQPKIWWIVMGNTDLSQMQCSEEVVVIGILRIVEYIESQRPNARIVINSLFPMIQTSDDLYGREIADYRDAVNDNGTHDRQRSLFTIDPWQAIDPLMQSDGSKTSHQIEKDVHATTRTMNDLQPYSKKSAGIEILPRTLKNHHEKDFERPKGKLLWSSIQSINRDLRKFAKHKNNVSFFDATEIFTKKDVDDKAILLTDRITVQGHPTELGFAMYEKMMATHVGALLERMRRDQPELFRPKRSFGNNDDDDDDKAEDQERYVGIEPELPESTEGADESNDDDDDSMDIFLQNPSSDDYATSTKLSQLGNKNTETIGQNLGKHRYFVPNLNVDGAYNSGEGKPSNEGDSDRKNGR